MAQHFFLVTNLVRTIIFPFLCIRFVHAYISKASRALPVPVNFVSSKWSFYNSVLEASDLEMKFQNQFRGLLIGHSFVSGYKHHLCNLYKNESPKTSICQHLNLSKLVEFIDFIDIPGGLVEVEKILSMIHDHDKYNFILIDLGSNDLAQGIKPLNVAYQLSILGEKLVQQKTAPHVVFFQIIPRIGPWSSEIAHLFNKDAILTNQILRTFCDVDRTLSLHSHRGVWQNPITEWSMDGIHLNSQLGRNIYTASLKRAILHGIKANYFTSN